MPCFRENNHGQSIADSGETVKVAGTRFRDDIRGPFVIQRAILLNVPSFDNVCNFAINFNIVNVTCASPDVYAPTTTIGLHFSYGVCVSRPRLSYAGVPGLGVE